jgi:hypothetical protein
MMRQYSKFCLRFTKLVFSMLDNNGLDNIIFFVKLFGVFFNSTKIIFYLIKKDRTSLSNSLHKD